MNVEAEQASCLDPPDPLEGAMRIDDLPDFLTVEETAAVLRIGRTNAYAEVRRWETTDGRFGIPCVRLGRSVRVPKAAIHRMFDEGTGPVHDAPPVAR